MILYKYENYLFDFKGFVFLISETNNMLDRSTLLNIKNEISIERK